jgi:methylenetetrahydrofolate dehydrogenase (NADP+)/methenyltetrahydrofolate cyclohydrolase
MKIDGNRIKNEILANLESRILKAKNITNRDPVLHIFVVGENPATLSFVKIKNKVADKIGVKFIVHKFEESISEDFLKEKILEIQKNTTGHERNLAKPNFALDNIDGIIIQLPLPVQINTDNVLNLISENLDIDMLSDASRKSEYQKSFFKSPIQKTLNKILEGENFETIGIVGMGKLIGQASFEYFKNLNKEIFIFEKGDSLENLKKCDVVVSGVGIPNLIIPDLVSPNKILIDFGYGNVNGKLTGDISVECYDFAKKYTTVPGGTGPIMVAFMFENLIESFERNCYNK